MTLDRLLKVMTIILLTVTTTLLSIKIFGHISQTQSIVLPDVV